MPRTNPTSAVLDGDLDKTEILFYRTPTGPQFDVSLLVTTGAGAAIEQLRNKPFSDLVADGVLTGAERTSLASLLLKIQGGYRTLLSLTP